MTYILIGLIIWWIIGAVYFIKNVFKIGNFNTLDIVITLPFLITAAIVKFFVERNSK